MKTTTWMNPYFLILILFATMTKTIYGRSILDRSRSSLISDGIDEHAQYHQTQPYLELQHAQNLDANDVECEQMYGFVPCSTNMFGNLFLIGVYEFLLFHGESYVASGSEQIFKILGPGIFGASVFHVLSALPESLLLLASGLLNSRETAQEYVVTGVGLLAGTSILLLTLLWGTCVILASKDFCCGMECKTSNNTNSRKTLWEKILSSLTGCGVITDMRTSYTARIMILSVIPLFIIQLPKIFPMSWAQRAAILSALIISALLLLLYFIYQIFEPWIQERRFEYVKHEQLVMRILQHVQKHAMERLLTEDGSPNIRALRRLFEEIDQDDDDSISASEFKELLVEIKFKHMNIDKDQAVEEVIKEFGIDGNQKISKDEFINGFIRWLEQAQGAVDKQLYSKKSFRDIYEVFQPIIQKKREERKMKQHLVSEILRYVQSNSIGSLLTEDGTPDLPAIRRLFESIDRNGDNSISESELKDLIINMKFGNVSFDVDEVVAHIIQIFGKSENRRLNQEEFVQGLANWLHTSSSKDTNQTSESSRNSNDAYQRTWKETDKIVYEEGENVAIEKSFMMWFKAIGQLSVGVVILAILAEPLIYSVQNFSKAANVPPFFISFILVPLATNAREATSAIKAVRWKKPRTTSLTFSEIYGAVFMSNILGFCVLLSLIYARDLTWDFSAEALVVLVVCTIVGLIASFRSTFPVWTSVIAYFLYPFSLILVYVLDNILNYS